MFQTLMTWTENGVVAAGNPARLKAAIEFHEAFVGYDDHPEMVHPHDFEDAWPENPEEVPDYFANPAQYQAWRSILISGLEAYSGQESRKSFSLEEGKDPWLRLRDRCRELEFGSVHETNLLALRRFALKLGIMPVNVTQDWAELVQQGLGKSERAIFRAGIGAFEKVRANPCIRGEFGLSETPIGQLQCKPSPNEECPLPPRLKADFEEWVGLLAAGEPIGFRGRRRKPVAEATLRQYRFAFAWYWRCFAEAFPDQSDPDTAELSRQDVLNEIFRIAEETKGLQLKPGIKTEYLGKTLSFLHRWNPQLVQPVVRKKETNEG